MKTKQVIQYVISLLIAGGLLWYVFKDLELQKMIAKLGEVDYRWIMATVCIFVLSHYLRAIRWVMLLKPLGYKTHSFRTFLAVMVGYFANLAFPRAGEVTRCGILKRLDNIAVSRSFGTVVAERIIDVFMLLLVVLLTFLVEFGRVQSFIVDFFDSKFKNVNVANSIVLLITGTAAFLVVVLLVTKFKSQLYKNPFVARAFDFFKGLFEGLLSIRKLSNPVLFVGLTVLMWLCYYFMSYFVFFAIPETAHLGVRAGLTVMTMGALGMAAPVQGGIGTFHILVSGALLLYGVAEDDGVLFATLTHATQTLAFVIFGALSVLIVALMKRKDASLNKASTSSNHYVKN